MITTLIMVFCEIYVPEHLKKKLFNDFEFLTLIDFISVI